MIPKLIHYCWFGRNPLPEFAKKCINSWRKFFPDYEIKEWNEDNFDVNIIPYTAEAYSVKKYAFVSDYARFWILYHYGGIYFDTDVEVIRPMDDIIERGAFIGTEIDAKHNKVPAINSGLGLGAPLNLPFFKEVLNYYSYLKFIKDDGTYNQVTVVEHITKLFAKNGLKPLNTIQNVADIWIYPKDFLNPLDDLTGKIKKTENTRSIHWYSRTWSDSPGWRIKLSRWSHRVFGLTLHRIKKHLFR